MSLVSLNTGSDVEAAANYWTTDRMANAVPFALPIVDSQPTGGGPAGGSNVIVPGAPPQGGGLLGAAAPVAKPQTYPWCTVGKLFFVLNGKDYAGSAAVVGMNGILTAAHCLYDPKAKATSSNVTFVPAYTNGSQPLGKWVANQTFVVSQWQTGADYGYDIGSALLTPSSKDPIGKITGTLGYAINQQTSVPSWNDIGYPSNYGGGNIMYEEDGTFTVLVDNTVGKEGTFAEGASGDPWLMPNVPAVTNGVHSHGRKDKPDQVFSSYFTDWVGDLIGTIR